jgi:hypothetical protein
MGAILSPSRNADDTPSNVKTRRPKAAGFVPDPQRRVAAFFAGAFFATFFTGAFLAAARAGVFVALAAPQTVSVIKRATT